MNSATKQHEKKVRECIARRFSQGWSTEQVAKRVWLCFGYLADFTQDAVRVRMHEGLVTFPKEVR